MAKLVRRGRKLVRCGGKLVRDTNGAPCACDGDIPPGLLKAIPCTPCCPEYTAGLPVDTEAVPGWETRPVFYLHGRCWQIVGEWDQEDPPEWMIVRRVFDFLRYQVCEACFAPGDCGILTPGCDAVGFVPDRYKMRVTQSGQADDINGSFYGLWTWNITTEVEYGPTRPCYKGCLTSPHVLAGGITYPPESFHEFGGVEALSTKIYGSVSLTGAQDPSRNAVWSPQLFNQQTQLSALYHLQWSNTVSVNQMASQSWHGLHSRFGVVQSFGAIATWTSKLTGPFWLRGEESKGSSLYYSGNFVSGDPNGSVRWSLRPIAYCCNDAPPPPDPKDDPQDEFGGGIGDGGSDPTPPPGGVQPDGDDPNAAAIEGAMGRDPQRRCRDCGG